MSDLIEDENALAPESETSESFRSSELAAAMLRLNPRQQRVLTERFGLDGGRPKTLEEVGEVLGITRERVRQLETRALRELRAVAPGARAVPPDVGSVRHRCGELHDRLHLALAREASQRVELDLPHALAGEAESSADLLEGLRLRAAEAVAERDDLPLALG